MMTKTFAYHNEITSSNNAIKWNPSCEATHFAPKMCPFKRCGLSSAVEINTLSCGLSRDVGLLSQWPL